MKIKLNTDIIKRLKPCEDRLDNWLLHYKDFSGDLIEFLDLPNISYRDKIWVAVRLMPRFLVEVFAIDCAFNAVAAASYARSAYLAAVNAAAYDSAAHSDAAYDSAADAYAVADAAVNAAAYASAAAYSAAAATAAFIAAGGVGPASADLKKQLQIESLIYLIQRAK